MRWLSFLHKITGTLSAIPKTGGRVANLFLVVPPVYSKKTSRNDPDFRFFSKIPEIDGKNPCF
jgi:hypothetical protein